MLIGSGTGNLGVSQCVQSFIDGICDAFDVYPSIAVDHLRIVERELDRAIAMLRAFEEKAQAGTRNVWFRVRPTLADAPGGTIPLAFSYSMLLAAVAKESGAPNSRLRPWLRTLLRHLPARRTEARKIVDALRGRALEHADLRRLALCFPIAESPPDTPRREVPTRLVFSFDARQVRTSAITETTTVTEREVPMRQALFDDLVLWLTRSNALPAKEVEQLGRFAFERLLHPDLAKVFQQERSTIIELNRSIAPFPFEMLVCDSKPEPYSTRVPLARQLRTIYSPPPVAAARKRITTALVIGNPGAGEYHLEACRREAEHVRDVLEAAGVTTTLLVGAPNDVTTSPPPRSRPAAMVAVQQALFDGVDLVHYCGHGVYDPDRPELAGWVFGHGNVLAAEDVRQMRRAPLLVVANACLTAQLSQRAERTRRRPLRQAAAPKRLGRVARRPARPTSDAGLVAGLADEFFRQGVRDFVGAAFAVPDGKAKDFAADLYAALLADAVTLGEAIVQARKKLFERWKGIPETERAQEVNPSPIWAAYEHYGDPTRRFNE